MNTSGGQVNKLSTLVLIAFAAGFPAAIAFGYSATQDTGQTLILGFLYLGVVAFAGLLRKVWQILEVQWAQRIAENLDNSLVILLTRYRTRYHQHLIFRHRTFDVKGLTTQGIYNLELQQVFVELSVAPKSAQKASSNPLYSPKELSKGSHSVWNYLKSSRLGSIAVIGAPGSGKTTLVKHITLSLAARWHRRGIPHKIPILLFLRNHAQTIIDNPRLTLVEAVRNILDREGGPIPPKHWFEKQLAGGKCLVMVDGLDEVADPKTRKAVADWVETQMTAYGKNRFIITSRPFGYQSNPLSGVTVLEVRPFNSDQVKNFVFNWYLANEVMSSQRRDRGVELTAREGAEDLLRRIGGAPALTALAVNPLLLTMIANVHRYRSSLPGRRVELYNEIFEVFLGKRDQAKHLELDLTPSQQQRVLQPLAYELMCRQQREIFLHEAVEIIDTSLKLVGPEIIGESFLKSIENSSGLLIEREAGVYSFAHLTFQEYLAAVHIQEQNLGEMLVAQVEESWWHETIRLYSARADATPIIAACFSNISSSAPILALAIECLEEAREIQPPVRAKLEQLLIRGVEHENLEYRGLVAEALLALRIRRMLRVDDTMYVDNSCVSNAEYQLFLFEQRALGKYHQPDFWIGSQFPEGKGRERVVGLRSEDAMVFCEWLTQREQGEWLYRLPRNGSAEIQHKISDPHWITDEKKFKLAGSSFPASQMTATLLKSQIVTDLSRDRFQDSGTIFDSTMVLAHTFARANGLTLDIDLSTLLNKVDNLLVIGVGKTISSHNLAQLILRDRVYIENLIQSRRYQSRKYQLVRNLVWDIDLILDRSNIRISDWKQVSEVLRWKVRFSAMLVAAVLGEIDLNQNQDKQELLQGWIKVHRDLYTHLAILEKQINDHLPAIEGIRMVKERRG